MTNQNTDDNPELRASRRECLEAFAHRRLAMQAALEASNIVHHRHICPCCGLPTIEERGNYELCMICLWEDGPGERDPRQACPPNYISLEQARIEVAAHLEEYERSRGMTLLDAGIDAFVRCLKAFDKRLRCGEAECDRSNFAANLDQVLAMQDPSKNPDPGGPQTLAAFLADNPRPVELRAPISCPKHACPVLTTEGWVCTWDLLPSNQWMDGAMENPMCLNVGEAISRPAKGKYVPGRVAWCPVCEAGM
ncbi:MAG: CPCC family cysteine-rich protein, partial [Nannocystaceae bacterium]